MGFLALSLDDTEPEALADAAARGFSFPIAVDVDMAAAAAYHIIGPGMFVVVDRDGTVARFTDAAGAAIDIEVALASLKPAPGQ